MTEQVEVRQWKAPNRLEVPVAAQSYLKEKGLKPKWVSKATLSSRMSEGYEIIPRNGKVKMLGLSPHMDSCFHVRELILCGMPYAMVVQRNKYYSDKNDRRMAAIKRGARLKQDAVSANKGANRLRGTEGERFVQGTGHVTITNPGSPVKLEPMLDEKETEADIRSLEKDA